MEIIGKSNLAGVAKSKISEAEAIISTHHFPDWQLHLLNYKLKKGHYLKPADLNRLFNNIKRISRFGLNSSGSNDTSSDDALTKTTCLTNTTSNETNTNNTSNLTKITAATPLTFNRFNSDSTFTINGVEIFVDGKTFSFYSHLHTNIYMVLLLTLYWSHSCFFMIRLIFLSVIKSKYSF
jgi:hypothetical protein